MRFLKITTFYPDYLRRFYRRHPLLAFEPFDEQLRHLLEDGFGWADFFQHALRLRGYDAHELVINAEALQRTWAREHGVAFPTGNWILDLAFEQVRHFNPEILFLDDTSTFPRDWIEQVRGACPATRLILGWSGTAGGLQDALPAYDAVLSCIPDLIETLRHGGIKTYHLHHGFEPRILSRIDTYREPTVAFSFVGQIVPGSAFHEERRRMLIGLSERTNIQIYSPAATRSRRTRARDTLKALLKPMASLADALPLSPRIRGLVPLAPVSSGAYEIESGFPPSLTRRLRLPVFGLQMFQLLHDSRATFNSHIGASRRSASNMRLFEATGAATCLVTDSRDNLSELFARDDEVVTYKSLDECIEKVRWLSENPARAREIGKKGQLRTLRDHTYDTRMAQLAELIRQLLA